MSVLTTKQLGVQLKGVPKWSKRSKAIRRTFKFKGFPESIGFVNRIAREAQKRDHHPDITILYNKVMLTLTTHDEGGITKKDISLARKCDEVFTKFFAK